jgi:hypothetical protein
MNKLVRSGEPTDFLTSWIYESVKEKVADLQLNVGFNNMAKNQSLMWSS